MRLTPPLALLAVLSLAMPMAVRGEPHQAMQPIAFLIGHWQTTSTFNDGEQRQGDLRYEWVLGGEYMKVTFQGQPPADRPYWEAHAMTRYDSETNGYASTAYFNGGPGVEYRGEVLSNGIFRLSTLDGSAGIDYDPRERSVYQENWRIADDGARQVTLRTHYEALD